MVGIGQADLAAGTEDADEHQHHEIPGSGNHETGDHQKTGGNGAEQGKVEDYGHGSHLPPAKGDHGIGQAAADRGQQCQHQGQCVGVKRGAHGRDGSGKTEQNDRDLHLGNPLPQNQQGKQAHPDGRGTVEHGDIGLPGTGGGIKEHDHADEAEKRPGQQGRLVFPAAQQRQVAAPQQHKRDRHADEIAAKDLFHGADAGGGEFDHRLHQGKG